MNDILHATFNRDTRISQELVDKTRRLSSKEFAILVNVCREKECGYQELSRLFDMRSDFGEYERAAVDAMTFDAELVVDKEFYWPLTEYILEVFIDLNPEKLLAEANSSNGISSSALKRRLDHFSIGKRARQHVFAKRPSYIIVAESPRTVEHLRKRVTTAVHGTLSAFDQKLTDDIVTRLTGSTESRELEIDDDFKLLRDHGEIDDYIDTAMEKIDELTREDETLVRIYGPKNCNECTGGLDGCRMFVCPCVECGPRGWFTGECDNCGIGIRKFNYAVRFPLKHGGFSGCYCSEICMLESPAEELGDVERHRIHALFDTLKTFGVYD